MLNESLRIMKGTIVEAIQDYKEKKLLEERQKQYVKDIVDGKFPELIVKSEETAEIIVKWCAKETNPVEFFLKQLEIVGVMSPVNIVEVSEESKYYSLIVKENGKQKLCGLHLSKNPKDYLVKEIILNEKVCYIAKNISYSVLGEINSILTIEKADIKLDYCKGEKIRILIENEVEIELNNLDWQNQPQLKLYPKAIALIEELKKLDKNMEPYFYYKEVKKKIARFFELKNVEINFSMKYFSLSTKDGKIVDYNNSIEGIVIKNYNKWSYKKYCTEKGQVIFEYGKIKIEGVKISEIQEVIESAEEAIKKVEELEY